MAHPQHRHANANVHQRQDHAEPKGIDFQPTDRDCKTARALNGNKQNDASENLSSQRQVANNGSVIQTQSMGSAQAAWAVSSRIEATRTLIQAISKTQRLERVGDSSPGLSKWAVDGHWGELLNRVDFRRPDADIPQPASPTKNGARTQRVAAPDSKTPPPR